jgi:hypothetical protein
MRPGAVGKQRGEAVREWPTGSALVEPKRRGGASHNLYPSDGAVEGETLRHDPLEEGWGRGGFSKIACRVPEKPIFPRQIV